MRHIHEIGEKYALFHKDIQFNLIKLFSDEISMYYIETQIEHED